MYKILYISYDGALDPLGGSQVLPYVEGLQRAGFAMTLLSYEKASRAAGVSAMAARLQRAGVDWWPERYHSGMSVLTTSYDLARGAWRARRHGAFDLIHARSYPSALLASRLAQQARIPWVFDVRGFYPEERVDGGLWRKNGALFRLTKRLERSFDRSCSSLVTLTHASVPVLEERIRQAGGKARVRVIPTCTDLERFTPTPRDPARFVLGYVGSLGTWYQAEVMWRLCRLAQAEFPDAAIRLIVNDSPQRVVAAAVQAGVDASRLEALSVPHDDVPKALAGVAATFFFIKPAFSKLASAATKLGESLAMGLPVLINAGVGDSERLVRERSLGVVTKDFSDETLVAALKELRTLVEQGAVKQRCREAACDIFSLAKGVDSYADIYRELLVASSRNGKGYN